jgi:hypothetical protein
MDPRRTRSSRMARVVAAVAAALAVIAVFAVPAGAFNRIPETPLRTAGLKQTGGLAWEEWVWGDRRVCVQGYGDGTGQYPKPLIVEPGQHDAWFVLKRERRPRKVVITAWRAVNESGDTVGDGQQLESHLYPRLDSDGERTAWLARFRVDLGADYYIDLYAKWPGDRECGGPRHLLRTYHIAAG